MGFIHILLAHVVCSSAMVQSLMTFRKVSTILIQQKCILESPHCRKCCRCDLVDYEKCSLESSHFVCILVNEY